MNWILFGPKWTVDDSDPHSTLTILSTSQSSLTNHAQCLIIGSTGKQIVLPNPPHITESHSQAFQSRDQESRFCHGSSPMLRRVRLLIPRHFNARLHHHYHGPILHFGQNFKIPKFFFFFFFFDNLLLRSIKMTIKSLPSKFFNSRQSGSKCIILPF